MTKSRVATVNQALEGEVQWKQTKLTLTPTATSTLSRAFINMRRRFSRTELSTMLYRSNSRSQYALEMTEQLNQLLADTITLRDLYKKSYWQVADATFYQLHLLFDKHFSEQSELVDSIAERMQALGGVSLAMAADVAETTRIERPPRGREEVPVQLSRLIDAHQIIVRQVRILARRAAQLGDDGTNDLVVRDVLRTNELQIWFLTEHLVNVPLVKAEEPAVGTGAA